MPEAHGPEIAGLARRVVAQAADGEEVEAYVVSRRDLDVRIFGGEVESLSSAEIAGIGVRVVTEHRQGFAYAGLLDPEVCDEVLADARDNAGFGTPDDALGLPAKPGTAPTALDLVAPGFTKFSTDEKVRLALDVERATFGADPRIRTVESSGYGDAYVHAVVASSNGIFAEQQRTIASIHASAIAEDGGAPQTGFGYDMARDPAELDLGRVAAEAAERSTRLLGATKPASKRVPVVLDQQVAQSLVGIIGGTLNGEAVVKGRSIFGDRVGEQIGTGFVTLVDDPLDPAAFGAASFDAEGIPTARTAFVDAGTLERFAHNTYTARRAGAVTTGAAVRASYKSTPGVGMRAFGIAPGDAAFEDLLRAAEGGVYIQSMQGLHSGVNPVSGDFSVGAEGCLIEGGALGAPFREATLASTLQRMLLDVRGVGAEVRYLSSGPAVALLIGEMTLGGT